MPILRHKHKTDYAVIPFSLLRDKRLSLRDIGLLCVMLSMADGWEFSVKGLDAIFPNDGESGLRTSLKRIEEAGYLTMERKRGNGGKMGRVEWTVSDVASPHVEKPHVDKPHLDEPHVDNHGQSKYQSKLISNQVSIKERECVAHTQKAFTPPTLEEVTAYCNERGNTVDPKRFLEYFEAGNWTDGNGKKVKNWKQKIITWERMDKGHAGKDTASEPTRRKYDGFKYD